MGVFGRSSAVLFTHAVLLPVQSWSIGDILPSRRKRWESKLPGITLVFVSTFLHAGGHVAHDVARGRGGRQLWSRWQAV